MNGRFWRVVVTVGLMCGALAVTRGYDYIKNDSDPNKVGPLKWRAGSVMMRVQMSTARNLSDGSSFASAMRDAMDAWNGLVGQVQLTAEVKPEQAGTDGQGSNETFFAGDVYGDAFGENVLAITTVYYYPTQRADGSYPRAEADIVFNNKDWSWDSYRGPLQPGASGKIDFRRVAVHELGHVLGLDHPDQATPPQTVSAIMNHTVSSIENPTADDTSGAQGLYGDGGSVSRPANDSFAAAATISGSSARVTGSSTGAVKEHGEPDHALDEPGGASVWWKWTAPASGNVTVTTEGSGFDTLLGAYTGNSVGALTQLAANDDVQRGVIRTSTVTLGVTRGTTYYFAVDGWDAESGAVVVNLNFTSTEVTAPSITSHPQNVTINIGALAQFSVSASGGGTLAFVWQTAAAGSDTWSTVASGSGGTSATYSFTPTADLNGNRYRCVVSNAGGSATSNAATLTVNALSGVIGVSAAGSSTHFLRRDGTLWAAGMNGSGELGDGTTTDRYTSVQVATDVAYLAPAASRHTLFIKRDGSLWGVGYNAYGQLGNGTTDNQWSPIKIADGVIGAAAGWGHSVFLKADRTLWAVGGNWGGQLGLGTQSNTPQLTPVQVATGVIAVAAGGEHTLFIRSDGSLWGMGSNSSGELGLAAAGSALSPTQIATDVTAVSAGYRHTLFVKRDGTLWGMGHNYYGDLGVGTNQVSYSEPLQIAASVARVSAAYDFSFFITTDNNLWGMGRNVSAQLGLGNTSDKNTLQLVAVNAAIVSGGSIHSVFVKRDGALWGSGFNGSGQMGDGGTSQKYLATLLSTGYTPVPSAPTGLASLTAVRGALLQWALSPDASYYEVWRHTANNPAQATLVARSVATPVYADLSAAASTTYYYWVRAANPGGAGAFSTPVTVQTAANRAPTASFSVGSAQRTLGDTVTISLTVDDPDGNFAYANLWVSTPGRGWMAIKADATTIASSAQGIGHAVTTSAGTFSRTFTLSNADGVGVYTFALAAVDSSGTVTFASNQNVTVTAPVVNQAPTASLSISGQELAVGQTITLSGTVGDPDGNFAYADLWVQVPNGNWYAIKADNSLVATSDLGASHATTTSSGGFTRTLTLNAPGTYLFALAAVDAASAATFAANQHAQAIPSAPIFTTQPQSLEVRLGATPTFTVAAIGTQPITYQWQRYRGTWENATGFPYAGDTTSTLTIESTYSVWNNERYRCIATNALDSTISSEATLALLPAFATITMPPNQTLLAGSDLSLVASVTSSGTTTYQWQKDGQDIPGATAANYSVASATADHSGSYRLAVTNPAGTVYSDPVVVRIISASPVARIFAGWTSTYLLLANGQLWSAGSPPSVAVTSSPVWAMDDVVGVAEGLNHTLFWKRDGTLWHRGRLYTGSGEGINYSTPTQIATDVIAAACGSKNTYYIKSDGTLWGVGANSSGQLGNGTYTDSLTPVKIADAVQQVVAGASHVIFLKFDGTLWGVGSNNGTLGTSTFDTRSTPVQVASGVRSITAGIADQTSYWITNDGKLFGTGSVGLLGLTGVDNPPTATPVQIDTGVANAAAGRNRVLYIKTDGKLWGRGVNSRGELGDGSGVDRRVSTLLGQSAVATAAGDGHTVLLNPGGTVSTTGSDGGGQLGDGVANSANRLAFSQIWSGVSVTLGAVSGVSASDAEFGSHVLVRWNPALGATSYEVWRGTTSAFGAATRLAQDLPNAIYADTTATPGGTYYYWVRAVNDVGPGANGTPDTGRRSGTAPNTAPTAAFTLSNTQTIGATVTISATVDDAENNLAYVDLWVRTPNRGWLAIKSDGSLTATGSLGAAHATATTTGTFTRSFTFSTEDGQGTYLFALAAVDNAGLVTFATNQYVNVTAVNQAPTASFTLSNARTVGSSIAISGNVADADGNLAYANLWVKTPNNGWRAIKADNSTVASDALGAATATTTTAGAFTRSFTFTGADGLGTYLFALAAVDSSGAVTFATNQYVTVSAAVSSPPTASFSLSSERSLNSTITISLSVGDTDGDLAYADLWVMTPAQGWFAIKADGSLVATSALSSAHATATATGSYTRTFTFTNAAGAGTYLFALAAVDGAGQMTFASNQYVTVTAANQAPAASFSLSSERTVGQTITISGNVSDADDNLGYADLWVMSPGRGWLAIKSDSSLAATSALGSAHATTTSSGAFSRTFTFTNADGAGTYLFALAAVDATGATTFASNQYVTISASGNQAPTASFTLSNERAIGQSITITGTVGDADNNLAYADLWVRTPNRGWIAIKPDNSLQVTDALGAAHATTTATGTFTRTFALTEVDGAGSYIFALAAVDSAGLTAFATNQYVSIVPAPAGLSESSGVAELGGSTSYIRWAQDQFSAAELTDPAISGPEAMIGDDGFTNLFKYALGLPAKSPVTRLPCDTTELDGQWFLTLVCPADRTDIVLGIEVSVDGSDWSASGVTLELIAADAVSRTWQGQYHANPGQSVEFRVTVRPLNR